MFAKWSAWRRTPALRLAFDACRRHLLYGLLFSAAINLIYLAPTLYMLQVYDRVLQSGNDLTLLFLTAVLIFALAVMAVLDGVRTRLFAAGSRRLDRLVTPIMLRELMRQSPTQSPAAPLQSFDMFRNAVTGVPLVAAMDAPWILIFIGVCFLIHPWIGVLTIVGAVMLLGLAWWNELRLRPLLHTQESKGATSYALIAGDLSRSNAARAMGMGSRMVARQLQARQAFADANAQAAHVAGGFGAATKFLRLVLQSAALGLGAYLAIRQQISPGSVVAASILATRAFAPLEQIVTAWRQTGQALQAFATIRAILETAPVQPPVRMALPSARGDMRMEGVTVLGARGEPILEEISLEITPGEVLGVIGPSGAGKSTLVRALCGAAACDAGVVRLDGAKLSDWPDEALERVFGYLPQDVSLFLGTVAENVARFEPPSPERDAEVVRAATAAGLHRFILSLPDGYDTHIGGGGRTLSAGQAQRIGLARALYRDPKVLVLDEPNAHLDMDGETALIAALRVAKERGAAVVLVAHRAQVMTIADRLLLLRSGRIEALGPRDDVLRKLAQAASAGPRSVVAFPPTAGAS
jgi:ATP-binding cassette subfamily C protein